MGWSDADTYLPYVQSILTMEILLDGQPLPTETYTEDMGVLCDAISGTLICLESDVFWAFALAHPLRPNVLHTVTLRWSLSGALDDPFGYSLDAGYVQETTGTLLVVPHPA